MLIDGQKREEIREREGEERYEGESRLIRGARAVD